MRETIGRFRAKHIAIKIYLCVYIFIYDNHELSTLNEYMIV